MASSITNPIVHHIRAEYLESPGLRLTAAQIQRMWRLDTDAVDGLVFGS